MKNFFFLLLFFLAYVFGNLVAKSLFDVFKTSFVPMTCSQNLYTQYHKLNLSYSDHSEFFEYKDKGQCFFDDILSDFSLTHRYIQSRNNSEIASYLWGKKDLFFQGSEIKHRGSNALVAEYFGLAPDTNMFIEMDPLLKNQVLDLQLAFTRGKGWLQINIPLMWSKWTPKRGDSCLECEGWIGRNNLDGGELELEYKPDNLMITGNEFGSILINGIKLSNMIINNIPDCVWFDNRENVPIDNSIIGQLDADESLPIVSLQNSRIETTGNLTTRTHLLADGGALCYLEKYNESLPLGIIPIGLYGKVIFDNNTQKVGQLNIGAQIANVYPVNINHIDNALNQKYAFGKFAGRLNNNFDFNMATKFNVADIPIMIGYDFYKNSDYHIGGYIKIVLPTGTKIDKDFLQYVLTPVIGNGHHFELGCGISSHCHIFSCDQYLYSIFMDGYLNKLFGSPQTRVFDLPNQPMSRYALAFPVSGGSMMGYSVDGDTILSIGDVNLYNGNVDAWRGEFILNFMCTYSYFEFGIGYAFAGQSKECIHIDCQDNKKLQNNQYGIVGQAAQNLIGIGIMNSMNNGDKNTAYLNNNITYIPSTLTTPPLGSILVNFFNLGSSNKISTILEGESAAYSYGTVVGANNSSLANVYEFENNQSGLMAGQVLNRIFSTLDYVWYDNCYQPEIGLVGSIGFSSARYLTAGYWDFGARCGFVF